MNLNFSPCKNIFDAPHLQNNIMPILGQTPEGIGRT